MQTLRCLDQSRNKMYNRKRTNETVKYFPNVHNYNYVSNILVGFVGYSRQSKIIFS